MADEKVLLVDDDSEFVETLSDRMTARGLDVDTATSGPEAIAKVEEGSYDAIVVDLMMPGMDGIETLKQMLKVNPDLQIILLTGHATVEKGVQAVKIGASDFLEKPANLADLLKKIEEAKSKRVVLLEKRMQEKIQKVMKSKGW
jgi:DNA-binding NtrC family response regulator